MLLVVAKAADPFDARDKIIQYKPDVMTCDIEMLQNEWNRVYTAANA